MDENTTLFIVSDHGGGPSPSKYVNFNVALREAGLLRLHQTSVYKAPDRFVKGMVCCLREAVYQRFSHHEVMRLKGLLPRPVKNFFSKTSQNTTLIDWSGTYAYRFEMHPPAEGVMVNLQGRQSAGAVHQEEYERVCRDVMAALKDLTDPQTGRKIVREIHPREEVYWGKYVQDAPDIVLLLEDGYRGGNGLDTLISEVPAETLNFWNGEHRMEGIFLAYGNKIRPGAFLPPLFPEDVAPSALYAAGTAAAPSMRGRIVKGAFSPTYFTTTPVDALARTREPSIHLVKRPAEYSPEATSLSSREEQALVERLRGLGYIE
jgi:predicted AlkP superfamily phosphohydrolase/phosphomutase